MIQDRIRDWLVDAAEAELPSPLRKWIIILLGSFYGGWVYAHSGSWWTAIQSDAIGMFGGWLICRIAEIVGEYIVKAILWMFPLVSIQK